jgi:hypothetical protein
MIEGAVLPGLVTPTHPDWGMTPSLTNSEVRNSMNHGVVQFTLNATSYDWQFIRVARQTFTDSGSQACH